LIIEAGMSQMFAKAKLADTADRVKPDKSRQRETRITESTLRHLGHRVGSTINPTTSTASTARCGPACRVVWEGRGQILTAPYPDQNVWGDALNSLCRASA